jgi:hypothetical protein
MRVAGRAFEDQRVSLSDPISRSYADLARGPGPRPLKIGGDVCVWETLAILEYLNEKFPAARRWPADRAARACPRGLPAYNLYDTVGPTSLASMEAMTGLPARPERRAATPGERWALSFNEPDWPAVPRA